MSELTKDLSADIGNQYLGSWDGSSWRVQDGPKPPRWATSGIPVGVCYAGSMFVCGNVLIGIGDALVKIASNVDMHFEDTGGLFLARGCGQILATLLCADLYSAYHGNGILAVCTAAVAAMWFIGPYIRSEIVLYLWFFGTGLLTATLDIGTQILTRRTYKEKAGPWLTGNTFCFATAGLIAPVVDLLVEGHLSYQFAVYGVIALLLAVLTFLVCPDCYVCPTLMPSEDKNDVKLSLGEKVKRSLCSWLDPVYRNDAVLALMIFFVIGSQNMMSNYLETFVITTGVMKVKQASALLSTFWAAMVISRLVAMFKLQPGLKTKPLIMQMNVMFFGCVLAAVPLFATPNLMGQPDVSRMSQANATGWTVDGQLLYFNSSANQPHLNCWQAHEEIRQSHKDHTYTWLCGCKKADPQCLSQDGPNQADHSTWPVVAGYLIYGFFVGPILGYIFDFHNRVTVSKERGSAILILGLNLGSSLVPFLFTFAYKVLGMLGYAMPVVELFSIIAPFLLMIYMVQKNQEAVNKPDEPLLIVSTEDSADQLGDEATSAATAEAQGSIFDRPLQETP